MHLLHFFVNIIVFITLGEDLYMRNSLDRINTELDNLHTTDPTTGKKRAEKYSDARIASELLYWDPVKLSRLRHGKLNLTTSVISDLAKLFNIREEYLLCYDDFRTEEERIAYEARIHSLTLKYREIFETLGYYDALYNKDEPIMQPDNLSLEDFYRLLNLKLNSSVHSDHIIAKKSSEFTYITLTEEEHKQLLDNITDFIQFSIEKMFKSKKAKSIELPKVLVDMAINIDNQA